MYLNYQISDPTRSIRCCYRYVHQHNKPLGTKCQQDLQGQWSRSSAKLILKMMEPCSFL